VPASELSTDPQPPSPEVFAAAAAAVPPAARASIARAVALVSADLADAEQTLATLLQSDIAEIPDVAGHVAFAGGKRLRPLVALLGAAASGATLPHRVTVAAVGELVHTATLLHDDVVDHGEFRRGRPAARMTYGNGLAVLTGDFCLSAGLVALADTDQPQAYRSLAQTIMRMSEGEVAQLCAAGSVPTRARYYDIIDRKTAALLAWCASVGGLVPDAAREPLLRFGTELGFAFQIADDLLDIAPATGPGPHDAVSPGVTGKEAGQDLRDGKITLPLALACETDPELSDVVTAALQAGPPLATGTVTAILAAAADTHALAQARAIAQQHAAAACAALSELPESPARTALEELTTYVVRRDR